MRSAHLSAAILGVTSLASLTMLAGCDRFQGASPPRTAPYGYAPNTGPGYAPQPGYGGRPQQIGSAQTPFGIIPAGAPLPAQFPFLNPGQLPWPTAPGQWPGSAPQAGTPPPAAAPMGWPAIPGFGAPQAPVAGVAPPGAGAAPAGWPMSIPGLGTLPSTPPAGLPQLPWPGGAMPSPGGAMPAPGAAPATDDWPANWTAYEDEVLTRVNAHRAQGAQCGTHTMPPAGQLQPEPALRRAARRHATDMGDHGFVDHIGSDGSKPEHRIAVAGFKGKNIVAENVAGGYSSPEQAVEEWMTSPGHCYNLMYKGFVWTGVGFVYNARSSYQEHWVQTFGD